MLNRYHRCTRRSLGRAPLAAWEHCWRGEPAGPRLPKDAARFRLDFLPLQRRVVGREGIDLFGLKYSCEALSHEVDPGKKRVVRYDPRDLSSVFLEQPNLPPLSVPFRGPAMPAFSLWELKAIKRSQTPARVIEEPEILRRVLAQAAEEGSDSSRLKRNRRAARREAWRSVQLAIRVAEIERSYLIPSRHFQRPVKSM
jgi:putative transposase